MVLVNSNCRFDTNIERGRIEIVFLLVPVAEVGLWRRVEHNTITIKTVVELIRLIAKFELRAVGVIVKHMIYNFLVFLT